MSQRIPLDDPSRKELYSLATRMLRGDISDVEADRLERMVVDDPGARRAYVELICDACNIRLLTARERISSESDCGSSAFVPVLPPPNALTIPDLPLISLKSPADDGYRAWAFAYTIASVVLLAVILVAWAIKTVPHYDIAGKSASPSPPSWMEYVGRITGMKDCQWSDPGTQTVVGAAVPLDREYALASGLLEITYKSGARVILEGPCTYEVDSDAGGYLAVGKLTARIDGAKLQAANSVSRNSSFIPHPSSFVVTTPTAIVTDLGTEFGVEVDENGDTLSYVFQGSVTVQIVDDVGVSRDISRQMVVLRKNESAKVSRIIASDELSLVKLADNSVPCFVREMQTVTSDDPSQAAALEYYFTEIELSGDVRAVGINDAGQVVGYVQDRSKRQAAYVYDSVNRRLRILPNLGGQENRARHINDVGQIVGCSSTQDEERSTACMWDVDGSIVRLDAVGKYFDSEAWSINGAGIVTGYGSTNRKTTHSFVFAREKGMIDIGGLGGALTKASDINKVGQIVGYSLAGDQEEHAFLYGDGKMTDLGVGPGVSSRANGINDHGVVVGFFSNTHGINGAQAFIYDSNSDRPKMRPLISIASYSLAFDINDAGQAVGYFWDGIYKISNHRAFIYVNGRMHDLNGLTIMPKGHVLRVARCINNSGQIAAWGTDAAGREFGCLLTPKVSVKRETNHAQNEALKTASSSADTERDDGKSVPPNNRKGGGKLSNSP